ncbi:carbamoyltransferase [Pseudoalteromonas luteoviolacea]|uniref:carbamoyltransferase family protein n=1 Tax=Pseudoalteromonas luteoviolacea TaxID=43657 RepID=UPI001B3A26E3|nr:carbamoyltransferase C-terminal domain-containing protein [Pseudoalteromonas luteoviolacea]MBQ4878809.1 carbamoyltransferase [Pseudoalteromonas luteoviolacea]MBQ4907783.1 carbamoyltransferase [Pseudoalteromonas luteoviolacea]
MKYYIGLATSFHDPAIAIVNAKGELIFAEDAERFLGYKRGLYCLPDNPYYIEEVLKTHCADCTELVIAKTWSKGREKSTNILENVVLSILETFSFNIDVNTRDIKDQFYFARASQAAAGRTLSRFFEAGCRNFIVGNYRTKKPTDVRYHDHHLTHAANACFNSPYDDATCIVVDGMGEKSSIAYYTYKHGKIKPAPIKVKRSFKSLGLFYTIICENLGFDPLKGEEWKVMGLAPYGKKDQRVYDLLRSSLQVKNGNFAVPKNLNAIMKEIKSMAREPGESVERYKDFAYTGQLVFGEIFMDLINAAYEYAPSKNLCISGGCSLNSSFMGTALERSKFDNIFVPSAPADDGNAIGAALLSYQQDNPSWQPSKTVQSPYTGSTVKEKSLQKLAQYGHLKATDYGDEVYKKTAEFLAQGKIIGWAQGRAEFGPRSLGNRSILANPCLPDMKDTINARVKFREEFRPFAPSILHEHGDEYFENYQESPYMERTLVFREEVRDKVPAVVHVDNTGRLQSVKKEWNEPYYNLISSFKEITGVPVLLNTSFNIMGKPIVHSVEDMLAVFLMSGIDVLVINNTIYEKS